MTDRELTEMAAKAIGLSGRWNEPFQWLDLDGAHTKGKARTAWSPLNDDGDALRLAVKLRIDFEFMMARAIAKGVASWDAPQREAIEELVSDEPAAVRRAIVRVAAAIGEKHD